MDLNILELVVTTIAAFAGAAIGAVITYIAQLKTAKMSIYTPARITAYGEFEDAMKLTSQGISKAVAAEIYEASNAVYLLASDRTIAALSEVQALVRQAENGLAIDMDAFRAARFKLLSCMRNDLAVHASAKLKNS